MNEVGEKSQATIIVGKFVNKPQSNSLWLIVFGNSFHWSKRAFHARSRDMFFSWTFDLLLINSSRYLLFTAYFSPHQRNIACEYKLHVNTNSCCPVNREWSWKKTLVEKKSWNKIKHFHLFLILMFKKSVFLIQS